MPILSEVEAVETARKRAVVSGMRILQGWIESRVAGIYDSEATLSLLEKRVADLRADVFRAGQRAAVSDDARKFVACPFPSAL